MSSNEMEPLQDGSPTKRMKTDEDQITPDKCTGVSFKGFQAVRILSENPQHKNMFVEGYFEKEPEKKAVVILEKLAFSEDIMKKILTDESEVKANIQNDIYNALEVYPPVQYNGVKSTLIYPATDRHITKYTERAGLMVNERPSDYQAITLPHIEAEKFSIQWVYNILDKQTESERIVYEDPDPETGFILLPDLKWNGKLVQDLYLVGIVHQHGIKSMRDLTAQHLPLLRNILTKGQTAITEKYGVAGSQLRIYLHYQPSYYHLHVHFTHLRFDAPGSGVERAHLLTDVIDNIELMSDYYQRKTLSYVVRENDKLHHNFKEAGKL